MTTTNCKALNWMIGKAAQYDKSEEHIVYRFRGRVAYRMMCEVTDWMTAQNAHYTDGRSRTSYNLKLEERVDTDRRWYNYTSINVSRGNYKGTDTDVEVMVTVYDCPISEEDLIEMQKAA